MAEMTHFYKQNFKHLIPMNCKASSKYSTVNEERSSKEKPDPVEAEHQGWRAQHFEELPAWRQDNEFIRGGYRPELFSFSLCLNSVLRVHNETANIWTHLVGSALFAALIAIYFSLSQFRDEAMIFLPFFGGTAVCLACSALYHTVSCHSHEISTSFARVDYAGIPWLVVGGMLSWLQLAFQHDHTSRIVYSTIIPILGMTTVVMSLTDKFNAREYRAFRVMCFGLIVAFSVIPLLHCVIAIGLKRAVTEASMCHMLIIVILDLLAGIVYSCRIPERFAPGRFDIWFHSHQIHHAIVVVAALIHYMGLLEMAAFHKMNTNSTEEVLFVKSNFNQSNNL